MPSGVVALAAAALDCCADTSCSIAECEPEEEPLGAGAEAAGRVAI
jgi:hypothetical protein